MADGQVLAAHAAAAVANSLTEHQLHAALATRAVIGQATGILIERFGISPDAAFGVLRRDGTVAGVHARRPAGHELLAVSRGRVPSNQPVSRRAIRSKRSSGRRGSPKPRRPQVPRLAIRRVRQYDEP